MATESVRNWVRQARIDAGDAERLSSDEKAELARLRRENRVLKQEREILRRAAAWFAKETGSTRDQIRFIDDHQAAYDIRTMCRVLGVSASGYYAWRTRPPSQRQLRHEALGKLIDDVHADSRRTYGYRRVHAELIDTLGLRVGRDQVALVMARRGLQGIKKRRRFSCTVRDETTRPAPDLVDRNFVAQAPDHLYVADITYVPTAVGFCYLAVVLDVFSRRIVGWSIDNHQRASLVVEALLREIHADLMTGVRGGTADRTPGEFRRTQNWIGGSSPSNARVVPPPVEHMQAALHEWEVAIHADGDLPVLVKIGLLHAQFETIHPFIDGNGAGRPIADHLPAHRAGRAATPAAVPVRVPASPRR